MPDGYSNEQYQHMLDEEYRRQQERDEERQMYEDWLELQNRLYAAEMMYLISFDDDGNPFGIDWNEYAISVGYHPGI